MTAVALTTSPVLIDDGSATLIDLTNGGPNGCVVSGSTTVPLGPGAAGSIVPAGEPVYANSTSGTANLTYTKSGGGGGSVSFGTTPGTAAEGNDSRIVGAAQKASNLADLASASTARTNLGLAAAATMTTAQIASDAALTATFASLASPALTGSPTVNGVAVATTATASGAAAGLAIVFGG